MATISRRSGARIFINVANFAAAAQFQAGDVGFEYRSVQSHVIFGKALPIILLESDAPLHPDSCLQRTHRCREEPVPGAGRAAARKYGARAGDRRRLLDRRHLGDPGPPGGERAAHPPVPPAGQSGQGRGRAHARSKKRSGDFCLVQDADLEYDPSEYMQLLRPLLDGHADAVFGSRYLAGEQTRVLPFWHSMINKGLTLLSNMFSNLNVTDMETCYKVFRTDLLKSIPIRSNRFGFEPEITMKCSKRKLRVYEVPISYHGRTYEEGKKIGWKDGVKALGVILYFWLVDDLYERHLRPRPAQQPDRNAAIS